MTLSDTTNQTPAELAEHITAHLREHFPASPALELERQVFAVLEEVGELIGAYRRWSGQARRTGTAAELHAELADVLLSAHIVLVMLGVNQDERPPLFSRSGSLAEQTLVLHLCAARLAGGHLEHAHPDGCDDPEFPGSPEFALYLMRMAAWDVLTAAEYIAGFLNVDPGEVCRDKAVRIFSRGWKDAR